MALQVETHVTSPIAHSAKAPEPTPLSSTTPLTTHSKLYGPPVDTVKLSLSAHIHQLKAGGQNEKQIAAALGIDTATVSSYFFSASSAKESAAAPAVAASSASASAPIPAVPANQTVATK